MGRGKINIAKKKKLVLQKENKEEDKIIKSLGKKLRLNKKRKHLPQAFVDEGLDYLLDICDEDTRKVAAESEKCLFMNSSDNSDFEEESLIQSRTKKQKDEKVKRKRPKTATSFSDSDDSIESNHEENVENIKNKKKLKFSVPKDDFGSDSDGSNSSSKKLPKKKSKLKFQNKQAKASKSKKNKRTEVMENSSVTSEEEREDRFDLSDDSEGFSDEDIDERNSNEDDAERDSNEDDAERDSNEDDAERNSNQDDAEQEDGVREDIYGRKINKAGKVIVEKKYIAPGLRMKKVNAEESQKMMLLERQIKGLLNRLAENNMHSIVTQLDELYMSNSRNDMNEIISNLMLKSIVTPVLAAERLVTEHMMCIAVLHANVGTEVGAHFVLVLVKKFNEMYQQPQEVENKELDNLVFMISHLYNFKVFGSQLIYQILEKLAEKFTEKEIEIILLILKTAGFRLRKDDPLALKDLVLKLQQKGANVISTNSRILFMKDVLLAIKNNNMSKIPQYDPSLIEHLKKVLRTLLRPGNSISQLNFSLEDLLNADQNGKWWVVGSAWSGKLVPDKKSNMPEENKPVYSQKILNLAKAQRMNTDARKNIFCILMTAEDYLDAFEKIDHLGLKDKQEREIIYVILNCCLHEKNFNPYYAVLLQKFCSYDRKYQMTLQYSLWDKFKMLNSYKTNQVVNIAKLLSYLFIQKALPISILKVIQLGELDKITLKLFKTIMLEILLHENQDTCVGIFLRIAPSANLQQFREGLRLFINYFLLKTLKKDSSLSEKQMSLLRKRIELVDKILTSSTSKVVF